ncbi:hypothetical protein C8R47DRAFT_1239914 [Mycena vitilis]|nr:hypothetical protein C8R47DRAFT_1239914 [Mycena vitilis]
MTRTGGTLDGEQLLGAGKRARGVPCTTPDGLPNLSWALEKERTIAPVLAPWRRHGPETHAYGRVREAIPAGLLQAIIASAIGCDVTSRTQEWLQTVVKLLRLYTVYYSVLSCLEAALRDVEALQTAHDFTHCFLFDSWCAFWDLAHERIDMLKYYDSADYVFLQACGALEASRVAPLSSSDSTDKYIWYCSKRCQRADWKDGHREACDRIVSLRQNDLSTRDRSLLRALIDPDYKLTQQTILLWELNFIAFFSTTRRGAQNSTLFRQSISRINGPTMSPVQPDIEGATATFRNSASSRHRHNETLSNAVEQRGVSGELGVVERGAR